MYAKNGMLETELLQQTPSSLGTSVSDSSFFAKDYLEAEFMQRKPLGHKFETRGYVWIYSGTKWVLEHRHLMEKCLNRTLTTNETVHHINGITNDNRIENLKVMWRGDHARLHNGIYPSRKEGKKIYRLIHREELNKKSNERYHLKKEEILKKQKLYHLLYREHRLKMMKQRRERIKLQKKQQIACFEKEMNVRESLEPMMNNLFPLAKELRDKMLK